MFLFALELNNNHGLTTGARNKLEGPELHATLYRRIKKPLTNESLGIKHCVGGFHGNLLLGGITNQPLGIGECDIRRHSPITLIIGDDLDPVILPHSDEVVGGTQIGTSRLAFSFSHNR
uniref:Uncharacterized protein n=1 Tax=Nelumbo nucifera TaxID=4432 RepID=A0A822ZPZ5_NELNU|nr:TPA_asm: hypothetical protein HUJ06_016840 [Nelumbo nucifera]